MSLNEFIDLVTFAEVVDDYFSSREIGTIFNLSMMTQIDEINSEKHMQMTYIEYIEAICRTADRVILSPGQTIE